MSDIVPGRDESPQPIPQGLVVLAQRAALHNLALVIEVVQERFPACRNFMPSPILTLVSQAVTARNTAVGGVRVRGPELAESR